MKIFVYGRYSYKANNKLGFTMTFYPQVSTKHNPIISHSIRTSFSITNFYDSECTLLMPLTNIPGVCLPSELKDYIFKEGGHMMLILLLSILGRRHELLLGSETECNIDVTGQ